MGYELPEDLEMTPQERYEDGPNHFIVYPSPHCEVCPRRLEGWPCSGPDPLPYSCSARADPNETMEEEALERKQRSIERAYDSDFDFPCSAGVRGIPPEAWDQARQSLEAWLDEAMADIERKMNEGGQAERLLDQRARRFNETGPPQAKTPNSYQEPKSAPKFLGIPERR